MIWAFSTVRNEADIVGDTFSHLLANGVDRICVYDGMSTDGTREILDDLGVTVLDDPFDVHLQAKLMNSLADTYCERGDWVLAVDADEYWYARSGGTIAGALAAVPDHVRKLHVRSWGHLDRDHREVNPRALPKVAFRWEPGAVIHNGNHGIDLPSGGAMSWDVLELREIMFRSLEHMAEKCRLRVDRIDPTLDRQEGAHQRRLAAMTRDELEAEWQAMLAQPYVFDPIPCSSPAPR